MSAAMAPLLPEPARSASQAWVRWGREAVARSWFEAAGLVDIAVEHHALPWHFPDVDTATSFLFEASPGHVAAAALVEDPDRLRRAVADHLRDFAGLREDTDAVDIEAAYVLLRARCP